jgi:hypothetical protein
VKSSPLKLDDLVRDVARASGYSEAAESAGNAFLLHSHRSRERGLSGARRRRLGGSRSNREENIQNLLGDELAKVLRMSVQNLRQ